MIAMALRDLLQLFLFVRLFVPFIISSSFSFPSIFILCHWNRRRPRHHPRHHPRHQRRLRRHHRSKSIMSISIRSVRMQHNYFILI